MTEPTSAAGRGQSAVDTAEPAGTARSVLADRILGVQRRGAALIVLGMAVALAVPPRALHAEIGGTPHIAAVPAAPPVGSCVDLESRTVVSVDCSSVHDGEVILALSGAPAAARGDRARRLPGHDRAVSRRPRGRAAHRGLVRPDRMGAGAGRGDGDGCSRTGGRVGTRYDWSVCLITAGAPFEGKVQGPTSSIPVSGAFRSCEGSNGPVSCAMPHRSERLADKWSVLADTSTTNAAPRTAGAGGRGGELRPVRRRRDGSSRSDLRRSTRRGGGRRRHLSSTPIRHDRRTDSSPTQPAASSVPSVR